MKHVFTDISKIAHMWANQLQDNARNSGNFYFDGKVIYSYGRHFPIAKHVVNDKGESAVLFTERTYSNTTSGHIAVVRQACNHLNIIYCYNPENTHKDNFNNWLISAENIAAKLLKAKKPEIYLSQLSGISARVNKYAVYYSIDIPETLQVALSIGNKNEYAAYQTKKADLEKQAQIEAQKELSKRHKKELQKWLNLEVNRLYVHNGNDYLRLNNDRIETTQAVQIPLETAKRLWQSIVDNKLTVGAKVLDYTVNEVGKVVKIGCHTFKTDYLIKFGQKIFA